MTFSVLGYKIGLARVISAISLSIIIGLSMELIFREKPEKEKLVFHETGRIKIDRIFLTVFFLFLIGILVVNGLQINTLIKYILMSSFTIGVILVVFFKFEKHATKAWLQESWEFAKILFPLYLLAFL